MIFLNIAVGLFILLEILNVLALYFNPTLKQANGVGIFKAYEKSKKDPEMFNLIRYMIYWVAGTKLIFLSLLLVIIIFGDTTTKLASSILLILSISVFYWKMYPLLKMMDQKGELSPNGYSRTLGLMIGVILLVLTLALIFSMVNL